MAIKEGSEKLIDPAITSKVKSGFGKFVASAKKVGDAMHDERQWAWFKEDGGNKK